jgi:hypothetical protein
MKRRPEKGGVIVRKLCVPSLARILIACTSFGTDPRYDVP